MGEISDDTADVTPFDKRHLRFFGAGPIRIAVDLAGLSHPGRVRSNNEDHFLIARRMRTRQVIATNLPREELPETDEDAYSMVIADGMGGAAFGELASRLALRTAWELGAREANWPLKVAPGETGEVLEKLQAYAHLLHESLLERIRSDQTLQGMGTTFTLLYTAGADAFIGHVGDSRAYLYRQDVLTLLTRDHTLAQTMIDADVPIGGPSEMKMMSRVLVNCLGGQEGPVYVDVEHLKLQDGDRLLLCTDGLTDMASPAQITATLAHHDLAADACSALIELALVGGGKDNVTAIVADYTFG
jgi:protein phosphatase